MTAVTKLRVHDIGKASLLAIISIMLCLLVVVGRAELGDIEPVLWVIVGYLVGNGAVATANGQPSAVLGPTKREGDHQ